ncbi:hypothetical protein PG997_009852 [Apiospora hydei]|uniref:Uncharacterized protein n=1 Tax=Apiospora hydei TaxID=1337664 RepID=A0ABR1VVC5_9PEZI
MPPSNRTEGNHSVTGVASRIAVHPTTALERKAERDKLSESRQKSFLSEPTSSSNRNVALAGKTLEESVAIKKSRKKTKKNLDSILDKLNYG